MSSFWRAGQTNFSTFLLFDFSHFSTFRMACALFEFSTFRTFRAFRLFAAPPLFDFSTFLLFGLFLTFQLFDFSTFRIADQRKHFSTFRLFGCMPNVSQLSLYVHGSRSLSPRTKNLRNNMKKKHKENQLLGILYIGISVVLHDLFAPQLVSALRSNSQHL